MRKNSGFHFSSTGVARRLIAGLLCLLMLLSYMPETVFAAEEPAVTSEVENNETMQQPEDTNAVVESVPETDVPVNDNTDPVPEEVSEPVVDAGDLPAENTGEKADAVLLNPETVPVTAEQYEGSGGYYQEPYNYAIHLVAPGVVEDDLLVVKWHVPNQFYNPDSEYPEDREARYWESWYYGQSMWGLSWFPDNEYDQHPEIHTDGLSVSLKEKYKDNIEKAQLVLYKGDYHGNNTERVVIRDNLFSEDNGSEEGFITSGAITFASFVENCAGSDYANIYDALKDGWVLEVYVELNTEYNSAITYQQPNTNAWVEKFSVNGSGFEHAEYQNKKQIDHGIVDYDLNDDGNTDTTATMSFEIESGGVVEGIRVNNKAVDWTVSYGINRRDVYETDRETRYDTYTFTVDVPTTPDAKGIYNYNVEITWADAPIYVWCHANPASEDDYIGTPYRKDLYLITRAKSFKQAYERINAWWTDHKNDYPADSDFQLDVNGNMTMTAADMPESVLDPDLASRVMISIGGYSEWVEVSEGNMQEVFHPFTLKIKGNKNTIATSASFMGAMEGNALILDGCTLNVFSNEERVRPVDETHEPNWQFRSGINVVSIKKTTAGGSLKLGTDGVDDYSSAYMNVGALDVDDLMLSRGCHVNGMYTYGPEGEELLPKDTSGGDWTVSNLVLGDRCDFRLPYKRAYFEKSELLVKNLTVGLDSRIHADAPVIVKGTMTLWSDAGIELYHENSNAAEHYVPNGDSELKLEAAKAVLYGNSEIMAGPWSTVALRNVELKENAKSQSQWDDTCVRISTWDGQGYDPSDPTTSHRACIFIDGSVETVRENGDSGNALRSIEFKCMGEGVERFGTPGDDNTKYIEFKARRNNPGETVAFLSNTSNNRINNLFRFCYSDDSLNNWFEQSIQVGSIDEAEKYTFSNNQVVSFGGQIYNEGIHLSYKEAGVLKSESCMGVDGAFTRIGAIYADTSSNIHDFTIEFSGTAELNSQDTPTMANGSITFRAIPGQDGPTALMVHQETEDNQNASDLILNCDLTFEEMELCDPEGVLNVNVNSTGKKLHLKNSGLSAGDPSNTIIISGALGLHDNAPANSTLVVESDSRDNGLWASNGSITVAVLELKSCFIEFDSVEATCCTLTDATLCANDIELHGPEGILSDSTIEARSSLDGETAAWSLSGDSTINMEGGDANKLGPVTVLAASEDKPATDAKINTNGGGTNVALTSLNVAGNSIAKLSNNGGTFSLTGNAENEISGVLSLYGRSFDFDNMDVVDSGRVEAHTNTSFTALKVHTGGEFLVMDGDVQVNDNIYLYAGARFFNARTAELTNLTLDKSEEDDEQNPCIESSDGSELIINGVIQKAAGSSSVLTLRRVGYNNYNSQIGNISTGYKPKDAILRYRPGNYATEDAANTAIDTIEVENTFIAMQDEDHNHPIALEARPIDGNDAHWELVLSVTGIEVLVSEADEDMGHTTSIGRFTTWKDAVAYINGNGTAGKKYYIAIQTDVDLEEATLTVPTVGSMIEITGERKNSGAMPTVSFAGDLKLTNNLTVKCVNLYSTGIKNAKTGVVTPATLNLNGKNLIMDNATLSSAPDNGGAGGPLKAISGKGDLTLRGDANTFFDHKDAGDTRTRQELEEEYELYSLGVSGAATMTNLIEESYALEAGTLTLTGDAILFHTNAYVKGDSKVGGNAYLDAASLFMAGGTSAKPITLTVTKNAYLRRAEIAPEWYLAPGVNPGTYDSDHMYSMIKRLDQDQTNVTVNGDIYMLDGGVYATRNLSVKNLYTAESNNAFMYGSNAADTFKVNGIAGEVFIPQGGDGDPLSMSWVTRIEPITSDMARVTSVGANNSEYEIQNYAVSVRRIDVEQGAYTGDFSVNTHSPATNIYSGQATTLAGKYKEFDTTCTENKKELAIVTTKALPTFFAIGRVWCDDTPDNHNDDQYSSVAFYGLKTNTKGTALVIDDTAGYAVHLYKEGRVYRYHGGGNPDDPELEYDDNGRTIVGSYQTVYDALSAITALKNKDADYLVEISAKQSNADESTVTTTAKDLTIPAATAAKSIRFANYWDWTDADQAGFPDGFNPSALINFKGTIDAKTNITFDGVKFNTSTDKNGNHTNYTFKTNSYALTLDNVGLQNAWIQSVTGSGTGTGSAFTIKYYYDHAFEMEDGHWKVVNGANGEKIVSMQSALAQPDEMYRIFITGDVSGVGTLGLSNVAMYVTGKANVGHIYAPRETFTRWDEVNNRQDYYVVKGSSKLITSSVVKTTAAGDITSITPNLTVAGEIVHDGDQQLTIASMTQTDRTDCWWFNVGGKKTYYEPVYSYIQRKAPAKYEDYLRTNGLPFAKVTTVDTNDRNLFSLSMEVHYDPVEEGILLKKGGMLCFAAQTTLPYKLSYATNNVNGDQVPHEAGFLTWADLINEIDTVNNKNGEYTATLCRAVGGMMVEQSPITITMPKAGRAKSLKITSDLNLNDEDVNKRQIICWQYLGDKLALTCDTTLENVRLLGYNNGTKSYINEINGKNYAPLAITTGGNNLTISGYVITDGRAVTIDGGNKGSLTIASGAHFYADGTNYATDDVPSMVTKVGENWEWATIADYNGGDNIIRGTLTKLASVNLNGAPLAVGEYYKSLADINNNKRTPSQVQATVVNLAENEGLSGLGSLTVTNLSLAPGSFIGPEIGSLTVTNMMMDGMTGPAVIDVYPGKIKVTNLNMKGAQASLGGSGGSAEITTLTIGDGAYLSEGTVTITNLINTDSVANNQNYSVIYASSGLLNIKSKAEVNTDYLLLRALQNTSGRTPSSFIKVDPLVTHAAGAENCTVKLAVYKEAYNFNADKNTADLLTDEAPTASLATVAKATAGDFVAWSDAESVGGIDNPHYPVAIGEVIPTVVGPNAYDQSRNAEGVMLYKNKTDIIAYKGSAVGAAVVKLADAEEYSMPNTIAFNNLGTNSLLGYYPGYTEAVAAINAANNARAGYVIVLLKNEVGAHGVGLDVSGPTKAAFVGIEPVNNAPVTMNFNKAVTFATATHVKNVVFAANSTPNRFALTASGAKLTLENVDGLDTFTSGISGAKSSVKIVNDSAEELKVTGPVSVKDLTISGPIKSKGKLTISNLLEYAADATLTCEAEASIKDVKTPATDPACNCQLVVGRIGTGNKEKSALSITGTVTKGDPDAPLQIMLAKDASNGFNAENGLSMAEYAVLNDAIGTTAMSLPANKTLFSAPNVETTNIRVTMSKGADTCEINPDNVAQMMDNNYGLLYKANGGFYLLYDGEVGANLSDRAIDTINNLVCLSYTPTDSYEVNSYYLDMNQAVARINAINNPNGEYRLIIGSNNFRGMAQVYTAQETLYDTVVTDNKAVSALPLPATDKAASVILESAYCGDNQMIVYSGDIAAYGNLTITAISLHCEQAKPGNISLQRNRSDKNGNPLLKLNLDGRPITYGTNGVMNPGIGRISGTKGATNLLVEDTEMNLFTGIDGLNEVTLDGAIVYTVKSTFNTLDSKGDADVFYAADATTIGGINVEENAYIALMTTYDARSQKSRLTVNGEITGGGDLVVIPMEYATIYDKDTAVMFDNMNDVYGGVALAEDCYDKPLMTAKKANPDKVLPYGGTPEDGDFHYKDVNGTIFITAEPLPIKIERNAGDGYDAAETYANTWSDAMTVIDNFATKADYVVTLINEDDAGDACDKAFNMGKGDTVAAPVYPKAANVQALTVKPEKADHEGELRYTGALNPNVNICFEDVMLSEGKADKQVGFIRTTDKTGRALSAFKLSNAVTVTFDGAYTERAGDEKLLRFTGGFGSTKGSVKLVGNDPTDDNAYSVITKGAVTLSDVIVENDAAIVSDDDTYLTPADMLGKVTIASLHGTDPANDSLRIDSVYTATERAKSVCQLNVTGEVKGATLLLKPIVVMSYNSKTKTALYRAMTRNMIDSYMCWDMSKAPEARLKFMDGAQIPSGNVMLYLSDFDAGDPTIAHGWFTDGSMTKYKSALYLVDPWNWGMMPIIVMRGDHDRAHWDENERSYYANWAEAVAEVTKMAAADNTKDYVMALREDVGAEFNENNYPELKAVTLSNLTLPTNVNALYLESMDGNHGFYFTNPAISVGSNVTLGNVSLNCVKATTTTVNRVKVTSYAAQNYNLAITKNKTLLYRTLDWANGESDYSPVGSMVNNITGGNLQVDRYVNGAGNVTVDNLVVNDDSMLEMSGVASTAKATNLTLWNGVLRAANINVTGSTEFHGNTELLADASDKVGTGVVTLKDVHVFSNNNKIVAKQNNKQASLITINGEVTLEETEKYIDENGIEQERAVDSEPIDIGLKYCNSTQVFARLFDGNVILTGAKILPDQFRILTHLNNSEEGHVVLPYVWALDKPAKTNTIKVMLGAAP